MRKKCVRKGLYQEWPTKGKLKDYMNLPLDKLTNKLENGQGELYSYVLTTIKNVNGKFVQKGCAPNFQGSLITLCTCKHFMRTWKDVPDWKELWIAGFTGINLMEDKRNYLFYITKVIESFPSHKAIWDAMSDTIRNVKNTQVNPLGDIYRPKPSIRDEFNHSNYYAPIRNHVHNDINNTWHNDIEYYAKRIERRPALLVGDTSHSFLWSRPIIYFKDKHPRTKKWNIQDLISLLESK